MLTMCTGSKHNFAIASTFLMHLLILTQPSLPSQSDPLNSSAQQPDSVDHPAVMSISPSSAGSPSVHEISATFSDEHTEVQALTKRWRWALRLAQRGAGGRKGLMNASLRRTEALFREWQIGKGTGQAKVG